MEKPKDEVLCDASNGESSENLLLLTDILELAWRIPTKNDPRIKPELIPRKFIVVVDASKEAVNIEDMSIVSTVSAPTTKSNQDNNQNINNLESESGISSNMLGKWQECGLGEQRYWFNNETSKISWERPSRLEASKNLLGCLIRFNNNRINDIGIT